MFSGLYDALNQSVSSVLPDGTPTSNPMHSPRSPPDSAVSPHSPHSPRSSLARDAPSPSSSSARYVVSGSSAANAGDGTQSPTYSTYQRRTKPSLEERLRASLAAKERGRMLVEKEKEREKEAVVVEEKPVPKEPEVQEPVPEAREVAPVSPPVEASAPFQPLRATSPVEVIPEVSLATRELPPMSSDIQQEQLPTPPEKPTQPIHPPPEYIYQAPTSPLAISQPPSIPTMHEEMEEPLSAPAPPQTIIVPPPLPSKYDDPLTPAFFELERERDAAVTKARLARSPPRASAPSTSPLAPPAFSSALGLSPSPTRQHFGHGRSRSMVPEGEPFIRFRSPSPSPGMLGATSLEHVIYRPGALEGLGLEDVYNEEGLKAWAESLKAKLAASQEETMRLQAKLVQHDGRMEELRDTHRLESLSQSELIESLRQKNQDASTQLSAIEHSLATERSLLAAERSTRESLIAAERAKHSTGVADLEGLKNKLKERDEENSRLQALAKEEEEKRTKAISLLKTVRTKLVKAEKDRDEALKEAGALRENAGAGDRTREEELRGVRSELERVRNEMERTRVEGSREIERVRDESLREFERRRATLENEVAVLRDSMERELLARRGEWEIEGIAAKTTHQKELAGLNSRISVLSSSLSQLADEKAVLFSDLQSRTSELESLRTQLEDLQSQLTEANYQLHERDEQLTMLQVELSEARRAAAKSPPVGSRASQEGETHNGAQIARLLAAAESRSEARVLELRSRLRTIESERAEQEESWSRSLAARTDEIERLRGMLGAQENEGRRVGEYRAEKEKLIERLEEQVRAAQAEKGDISRRVKALEKEVEGLKEGLEGREEEAKELKERIEGLMGNLEELRGKEAQLKLGNKTLREELRKVQSSAALLERQRNPGVGYWSAANPRTPLHGTTFNDSMAASSTPDLSRSATGSSQARPGTPVTPASAISNGRGRAPSTVGSTRSSMDAGGSVQGEEEVNLEYLRNVILQFLEHEKMRPNLVRVLSVILRFTPQETRRLIAKV